MNANVNLENHLFAWGVRCKVNEERHTPEHVFGMVYTLP